MPPKEKDPRLEILLSQPIIWGELFTAFWRSVVFNTGVALLKRPHLSRPGLNHVQQTFIFSTKYSDIEAAQRRVSHNLETTWTATFLNAKMAIAAIIGNVGMVEQTVEQLEKLTNASPHNQED